MTGKITIEGSGVIEGIFKSLYSIQGLWKSLRKKERKPAKSLIEQGFLVVSLLSIPFILSIFILVFQEIYHLSGKIPLEKGCTFL